MRFMLACLAWLTTTLAYWGCVGLFLFAHIYGLRADGWRPAWYVNFVMAASLPLYGVLFLMFILFSRLPTKGPRRQG